MQQQQVMPDYYKILGVHASAEPQEIKKAYRRLALQWHPDKNPDNLEEATVKFKQIAEAYQILGKSENRQAYDSERLCGGSCRGGAHGSRNPHRDFEGGRSFYFNFSPPDEFFCEMFDEDLFDDEFLEDVFPWFQPPGDMSQDYFPLWNDDLFPDIETIHAHYTLDDGGHFHRSSRRHNRTGSRQRRKHHSGKRSTRSDSGPAGLSVVTTSISTRVVDGVVITTKRRVENGQETTTIYENDVLKSETVRGLHNVD